MQHRPENECASRSSWHHDFVIPSLISAFPAAIAHRMVTILLGPEAIIIGDERARVRSALLEPVEAGLRRVLSLPRVPEIWEARHGEDAGCLGATIAVLRQGGLV